MEGSRAKRQGGWNEDKGEDGRNKVQMLPTSEDKQDGAPIIPWEEGPEVYVTARVVAECVTWCYTCS